MQTDALLANDDGPNIRGGGMLKQMIDRIAANNLDPLALEDLGNGLTDLHRNASLDDRRRFCRLWPLVPEKHQPSQP